MYNLYIIVVFQYSLGKTSMTSSNLECQNSFKMPNGRVLNLGNDYNVGKYCISHWCIETYPCRHNVVCEGEKTCMGAVDILKLYEDHAVEPHKHFDYLTNPSKVQAARVCDARRRVKRKRGD